MKRGSFLLIALCLASLSLVAWNQEAGGAPKPMPNYVVVDPLDLRQPIPDPEQGLTDKYDGKLVRFTGQALRVTVDKKTKKHHYELQHDIVQHARAKGKEVVVGKETITVAVTFLKEEKELHQLVDKALRAKQPGPTLTVEGMGSIMVDGSLVITDAVLIAQVPEKRPFSGR